MPEESPPTAVSEAKPALGDEISPADREIEIPDEISAKLTPVSLSREEICRLAKKDRTIRRLLREMEAMQQAPMPERDEIQEQLTRAKRELAKYHHLKAARERQKATVRLIKMRVWQRLVTVQEREEGKIVTSLERKLGVCFRTGKITK